MSTRMSFPPSTGVYRLLIVPMLEPGQVFRDADLGNLANTLRVRLFNEIAGYFSENSFGQLDVQAHVFGHDVLPRSEPLRITRAISDFWNPSFEAGGLDAVETGLGATPTIRFDGTEAAEVRVRPRERPTATLDVTFSALSAESVHAAFPVTISFTAGDQLRLRVTDKDGTVRDLEVSFTVQPFPISAATLDTDLTAIAAYLDGRVAAGTAVADRRRQSAGTRHPGTRLGRAWRLWRWHGRHRGAVGNGNRRSQSDDGPGFFILFARRSVLAGTIPSETFRDCSGSSRVRSR